MSTHHLIELKLSSDKVNTISLVPLRYFINCTSFFQSSVSGPVMRVLRKAMATCMPVCPLLLTNSSLATKVWNIFIFLLSSLTCWSFVSNRNGAAGAFNYLLQSPGNSSIVSLIYSVISISTDSSFNLNTMPQFACVSPVVIVIFSYSFSSWFMMSMTTSLLSWLIFRSSACQAMVHVFLVNFLVSYTEIIFILSKPKLIY